MTTLHAHQTHDFASLAEPAKVREPVQAVAPRKPFSAKQVEAAIERARVRAVVGIVIGCMIVAFVLSVVLMGWQFAALGTIGLSLTGLMFGLPFWLAVIDAKVEDARKACNEPV